MQIDLQLGRGLFEHIELSMLPQQLNFTRFLGMEHKNLMLNNGVITFLEQHENLNYVNLMDEMGHEPRFKKPQCMSLDLIMTRPICDLREIMDMAPEYKSRWIQVSAQTRIDRLLYNVLAIYHRSGILYRLIKSDDKDDMQIFTYKKVSDDENQ
jgi:hypothetical protein